MQALIYSFISSILPFGSGDAEAAESDKVSVVEASQELHLPAELFLSLPGDSAHSLDGCHRPILEPRLVHRPKPALPDHTAKIISRLLDLAIGEPSECGRIY